MILRIAVVTQANYRELKKLCHGKAVGKDYADFARIVDETLEQAKQLGIDTVCVPIDPPKFALWLDGRKAKKLDLHKYADLIHRNPMNHDKPIIADSPSSQRMDRPLDVAN